MGVTQIKIFKGVENEAAELEREVNQWLASFGGKVLNVVGNIAPQSVDVARGEPGLSKSGFPPSDLLLIVIYEK